MKDWLTIGQFSKKVGVSAKALRIYEEKGLLRSHSRGDNGYRYYQKSQLEIAYRLKDFKDLGFSLNEIKTLLSADVSLDPSKLAKALERRLELYAEQEKELTEKTQQIQRILTSLKRKKEPLRAPERKYIMRLFQQISVVVTGVGELDKTAEKIQEHLRHLNIDIPITVWDGKCEPQETRPGILVVHERHTSDKLATLQPDVIVVRNLGNSEDAMIANYLNLFQTAGPQLATIINADDRASVKLAREAIVQKGAIYYFTKNSAFEKQIKNIGGIVSDGEEIKIYGYNNTAQRLHLKLKKILAFDEEVALLSSLAAVMDIGIPAEKLENAPAFT